MSSPRVFLVNPANRTVGYSMITPRWLFVIAGATPTDLVGDPILIDEPVTAFEPDQIRPGDIVGVGIHSGNCLPGYRVTRAAKARGATVLVGGIHATLFPEEPLAYGADAVVTGNGDLVWHDVVLDALRSRLQPQYHGGRVPGDQLGKARWDLVDPSRYMMASIQTIAGCPENCSFCSVWVTEGRKPRQHLTEKIIEEANDLWRLGFRYVMFADDNFNPATLGRIAREPHAERRRALEHLREERLRFFLEYDRKVPPDFYGFTQMTTEVASDDEYLDAMRDKMRIRGALIGVESFTAEGLKAVNKAWNPSGEAMVETIRRIQDRGIFVLASIIGGLETDTVETLVTMRKFAVASRVAMAQFPVYSPYPGTVDYHEMLRDLQNRAAPAYRRRHAVSLIRDKYWLEKEHADVQIVHPTIPTQVLTREIQRSWAVFYSVRATIGRMWQAPINRLSWTGRLLYGLGCFAFRILYRKGLAADNVRDSHVGWFSRLVLRVAFVLARRPTDVLHAPKAAAPPSKRAAAPGSPVDNPIVATNAVKALEQG